MKLKTILITTGSLLAVAAPVVATVSCGSASKDNSKSDLYDYSLTTKLADIKYDFGHKDDSFDLTPLGNNIKDATIVKWIDGDTMEVEFAHDSGVAKNTSFAAEGKANEFQWNIRVTSIDTPELHTQLANGQWVETTGLEKTWGDAALAFGEKVMPVGKKVKIYTTGEQSYNRMVGSLFFKKDGSDATLGAKDLTGYDSYAVAICRAGYTIPFVGTGVVTAAMPGTLLNTIGLQLADAFNYALFHHLELFQAKGLLEEVYGVHGVNNTLNMLWRNHARGEDDEANIYDIFGIDYTGAKH